MMPEPATTGPLEPVLFDEASKALLGYFMHRWFRDHLRSITGRLACGGSHVFDDLSGPANETWDAIAGNACASVRAFLAGDAGPS
ncbi:MAG: hypothetical protein QM674_20150 [Burkholderiaceae bacterium]